MLVFACDVFALRTAHHQHHLQVARTWMSAFPSTQEVFDENLVSVLSDL